MSQLGADVPLARAAWGRRALTGRALSEATVRRQTAAVGASALAQAEAAGERLEHETPAPAGPPARLVLGADGALGPLVGGEWGAMKRVSGGDPQATRTGAARPTALSSLARLADAETGAETVVETGGQQALVEMPRRGDAPPWRCPAVEMPRRGDAPPWGRDGGLGGRAGWEGACPAVATAVA